MRATAHYIFSVGILTIYGGEVCPFLGTLDILTWAVILTVVFGAAFCLRPFFINRLVLSMPFHVQVKRQFAVEIFFFFMASLFIVIYNAYFYNFPLVISGAKVMTGCLALGFFAAIDLALEREREVGANLTKTGQVFQLNEKYYPMTVKFTVVASFTVALMVILVFLVISRDLMWLGSIDPNNLYQSRLAVMVELAFIGAIILAEIINMIISYSRNLTLFFRNENNTLVLVANGDLNARALVSTNDEFGFMASYTNSMIDSLQKRTDEIQLTRDVTILGLASLAETRDNETGAHILRTQRYVKALAKRLAENPKYKESLDGDTIELLFKSAPLHDIGKVGVRDSILLKPGKLTVEEFEEMKKHTIYGRDSLQKAGKMMGSNSFLSLAEDIAYTHHEKWDGSGYPNGLKGDEISISGRLMALADVYDALISKRVYKEAFSHEKARGIIIDGKGRHFDPDIVDVFVEIEDTFREIADQYADNPVAEVAG